MARAVPTDDGSQRGLAEELAELVLNGRDRLGLVLRLPAGKLALPERADHGIGQAVGDAAAELAVGQQPLECEQRGGRQFEQGEQGVAQNVLQTFFPTVAVELLERRDDPGGDQPPLLGVRAIQRIVRRRELPVGGIEEHDVVGAARGDCGKQRIGEIAVWIEQC